MMRRVLGHPVVGCRHLCSVRRSPWLVPSRPAGHPRRLCSRSSRTNFSDSHFAASEETSWPLYAGGALAVGVLGAGLLFQRESVLRRVHGCIEPVNMLSPVDADGMSTRSLFGLVLAFSLTQLPVDELKLKLLAVGALQRWGELAASYDIEVQQIALGALTALLDGEVSATAFRENPLHYRQLVAMLPPLLHSSSPLLFNADVHRDVLRLGSMLTAHPSCALSHDDVWLWERLLEFAIPGLELDAAGEVDWAGIAAAASEKGGAAELLLLNPLIQRWLVHLAEEPPREGALGAEWLTSQGDATLDGVGLELPRGGSWPAEGVASEHRGDAQTGGGRQLAMSRDELDEAREDAARLLSRLALHRLAEVAGAQEDSEASEEARAAPSLGPPPCPLHAAPLVASDSQPVTRS